MKIFRTVGLTAVALIIISAFLPWALIDFGDRHLMMSGMDTGNSNFGKPGILSIICAVLFLFSILIPKVWAKRWGIFLAVVIVAWNVRNLVLFSRCEMGYCPSLRLGIFLALLASAAILVASVLPYVPEKYRQD